MKAFLDRYIPRYMYRYILILIITDIGVYYGAKLVNRLIGCSYYDMTCLLDTSTPFVPAFSIVYILAFPFWYTCIYFMLRKGRELSNELVTTIVVSKIVCALLFIIVPTTNIRPQIIGNGPGEWVLGIIYSLDYPDNLFPSIHCLESWICFAFVLERKEYKWWVKLTAFLMTVAICLSTVFTRQHVWVDVLAGVMVGALAKLLVQYAMHAADSRKKYVRSRRPVPGSSILRRW